MEYLKEDIDRLKASVEHFVGREIKLPRDFVFLEKQVECYTGVKISQSTLKRLWGYVSCESAPSYYVLDTLVTMLGYTSWTVFVKRSLDSESSCRIVRRKLSSSALSQGD